MKISTQSFNDVHNRPLSKGDLFYFENGYSLRGVFYFRCKSLTTERVEGAFHRFVSASPLLQTHVQTTGPNDDKVFVRVPKNKWPKMNVEHLTGQDDKDLLIKAALDKSKEDQMSLYTGGPAVRGSTAIISRVFSDDGKNFCLTSVAPHFFMDGAAQAAWLTLVLLYSRVPRVLWSLIDRRSNHDVPTFHEMLGKSEYTVPSPLFETSCPEWLLRDRNFEFAPLAAEPTQNSGAFLTFQTASNKTMSKCRKELRENGISVSSAFTALALKTVAVFVDKYNLNPEKKPLISVLPADGRQLGRWRDKKRNSYNKKCVPAVANYAFASYTRMPYDEVLGESLVSPAKIIVNDVSRLRKDPEYRKEMSSLYIGEGNPAIFTGASSVVVPRALKWAGIKNGNLESSQIDFGPMPHCWFYVLTVDGQTQLMADVGLPIDGITEKDIVEAVQTAASNSPLESLFRL